MSRRAEGVKDVDVILDMDVLSKLEVIIEPREGKARPKGYVKQLERELGEIRAQLRLLDHYGQ